jgi:hypothetical protein
VRFGDRGHRSLEVGKAVASRQASELAGHTATGPGLIDNDQTARLAEASEEGLLVQRGAGAGVEDFAVDPLRRQRLGGFLAELHPARWPPW